MTRVESLWLDSFLPGVGTSVAGERDVTRFPHMPELLRSKLERMPEMPAAPASTCVLRKVPERSLPPTCSPSRGVPRSWMINKSLTVAFASSLLIKMVKKPLRRRLCPQGSRDQLQ